MRYLLPVLLLPAALGGCKTGYASDWFRDETSIINPQLIRYGLDVQQSRCVGEKLGASLSKPQLRQLQMRAAGVRRGLYDPARFTMRDLKAVASAVPDRAIRPALDTAAASCGVGDLPAPVLASTGPAPATTAGAAGAGGVTSGGVPVDMTPITPGSANNGGASAAGATWLNLGAAESGQSIAIDAMSIQQEGQTRIAWFRMTDPQSGGPSTNSYRLRIDCQAKTVQPLALRQFDASGAQTSLREYKPEETAAAGGAPESGTVLEIAFLSLCT